MKRLVWTISAVLLFLLNVSTADAQDMAVIKSEAVRAGVLDIERPVVTLAKADAADKINAVLAGHVERFRASVAENSHTLTAHSRYVVHRNTDGLLSLTITDYVFTGGAHGMSYRYGYTFDLATGYQYTFSDLVPLTDRDGINTEIIKQIAASKTPMLRQFVAINPEPDFYLLPGRELAIFYQLYELAPYAWGFVTFPIKY